jgi:quercetin dioxygenase-like cupin family protein
MNIIVIDHTPTPELIVRQRPHWLSPDVCLVNVSSTLQWEVQMKILLVQRQTLPALAICFAVGVGAMVLAQHTGEGQVKVTQLSQRDIIEKLDGKYAKSTVEVVTIEPGQKDSAHRHTGPVFGFVLEGEYEHAINDEPIKTYKAGETFYEPSGSVHRVTHNPSAKTQTRLLAVILHPRDAKEPTVREKSKE